MTVSRAQSLAKLFENDRRELLLYVRRLLGGGEGAEDIVQEALLRTYQYSDVLIEPRAFAFTAARNLVANSRRHRRLAPTDTFEDFRHSHVAPCGGSPEVGVLREEERRLLRDAVQRLTPQCRAALTLRMFQDRSYKEIALLLGISPKTVENHIGRAVRVTHDYLRVRYQLATESGCGRKQ